MEGKSTREHLIDVGVELMHRHGYNATGLAEILKAADVPKGSFYHHFGSKEDFAAAALERYAAREAERGAAVLADTKVSPVKRLKRYFNYLMKVYGQSGPISGCMMGRFSLEIAAESPELREQISELFTQWQEGIASVIREGVEQGEIAAGTDADALAGFLLNSWQGALVRSQAEKSDAPLKLFLRYGLDVLHRVPGNFAEQPEGSRRKQKEAR